MAAEQTNKFIVFLGVLNTLTNLILGAVIFLCCLFGFQYTGSLQQHVVLCVIGYGLMMSQGIMSISKTNGWSANLNYYNKNIAHRAIGIIGAALAIAGSAIRIQGWPGVKFSTTHGVFGLIALILTCLSLIGGVTSLYVQQKKLFRTFHAIAGCLTFVSAMICLCLGIDKPLFRTFISTGTADAAIVFTCLAIVGVVTNAGVGIFRRIFS